MTLSQPPIVRDPAARPRLLGERAACHDLGIRRTLLWKLIKNRELEVVRIGARTLVTSNSIDKLIEKACAQNNEGIQHNGKASSDV